MRDYAIVPSKFWIGPLAKKLRGNPVAQVVALYLTTGLHANMIGLYHCPIAYIAQDAGIPFEGASQALASLIEAGYCDHDNDAEVVFVRDMAREQIGESLAPTDKRVKAVIKQWQACPSAALKRAFYDRYARAFSLPSLEAAPKSLESRMEAASMPIQSPLEGAIGDSASPFEAPSNPLQCQEQETEKDQDHSVPFGTGAVGAGSGNGAIPMTDRELAEHYVAFAGKAQESDAKRSREESSALWKGAKSLLWLDAGLDLAKGGALLGKLLADYNEIVLTNSIVALCRERPAGPAAWLKRACQLRSGEASKTNKQGRLEASNAAAAEAFLSGGNTTWIDNKQTALEASNAAAAEQFLKGA